MKKKEIIIVDDHLLISNSLKKLIDSFQNYQVTHQLKNGIELLDLLDTGYVPDLILLDVKMPIMDGKETISKIFKQYNSALNILVLSVEYCEKTIIHMIRNGAKGYIFKDIDIKGFKKAIEHVILKGFYHNEHVASALVHEVQNENENFKNFSEREMTFLKYACSEMTYKEIASEMCLSPKTIDGYRESLFKKIGIKNRVGLAIYAIKNKIVSLH